MIVGFFIPQYANLSMLKINYFFFTKFCDVDLLEELKTDTLFLFLALAHDNLFD